MKPCDRFITNLDDPRTHFNGNDHCMICDFTLTDHLIEEKRKRENEKK